MATQIEVLKVIKVLGDAYPTFQLTRASIEVYVRLLADVPAELLEKATLDHISRSTFFPTIAELRGTAFDLLEQPNDELLTHAAWQQVQAEIQRVGHRGEPQFSDPLVAETVKIMGWHNLCLSDNPISERSHFVHLFRSLAERKRQEERRLPEVQRYVALQAGKTTPSLPEAID